MQRIAATGEYVQLYQGGTAIASATDSSFTGTPARNWAIDIDLANRATPYDITASVLDAAGNTGAASAVLSLTVDTSGGSGTATTPDLNATDDTGLSSSDNITNKTTGLTFSGLTSGTYKNDYVQLYNGGTVISGALSSVFGTDGPNLWSVAAPLGVGAYTIAARIFDLAGNQSTGALSAALPVTIETTPPVISAPAVLMTTEGVPYDLSNGVVTITGSEASRDSVSSHASTIGVSEVTIEATDTAGNTASVTRSMVVLPQAVIDAGGAIGTVRVVDNDTDLTGSIGYPSGVTPAYTGIFEWRDSSYMYVGAAETTVPTTIGYTVTENVDGYSGYRSVTEVAVDISAQSGKQFTTALVCLPANTASSHLFVNKTLLENPTVAKGSGFVCLQHSFDSATTSATFAMGRKRSSGAARAGEYIHFEEVNDQAVTEPIIHKPGTSHLDIKEAQTMLNRTACKVADTGPGSPGNETEYFGAKTEDAIFCFQKEVGLNQTGIFDPPTRYALFGIPAGQEQTPAAQTVTNRITTLQTKLIGLLQQLRNKLTANDE